MGLFDAIWKLGGLKNKDCSILEFILGPPMSPCLETTLWGYTRGYREIEGYKGPQKIWG